MITNNNKMSGNVDLECCPNCGETNNFEIEDHDYNEKTLEVRFDCGECDTKFSDWYDVKFRYREITDDPSNLIKKKEARFEILNLIKSEQTIQDLLHENHIDSNCQCDSPSGTATMRSEGAGDIEVCLDCFGAEGCVY